jgi:hypothetical protein
MADNAQKGPIEQERNTTEEANVKAPADTGDRELSDADLDKVSGGANSTPPPTRDRPSSRAM